MCFRKCTSLFCRLANSDESTDGILNVEIAKTLAKGTGHIHGIDSSASMIASAQVLASKSTASACTFQGTFDYLDQISFTSNTC